MHMLFKHKESIVDKVNQTIDMILAEAGTDPLDSCELDELMDCMDILKDMAKAKYYAMCIADMKSSNPMAKAHTIAETDMAMMEHNPKRVHNPY